VANGLDRQINIELWPIEMLWGRGFDVRDLVDSGFTKPGEVLERQKDFFIGHLTSEITGAARLLAQLRWIDGVSRCHRVEVDRRWRQAPTLADRRGKEHRHER